MILTVLTNRHLLAAATLMVLLGTVCAFQTTLPEQIQGATVQFRRYEQTAAGETTELGTKTAYLSKFGNWTTIKRNVHGVVEQTLVADRNRGTCGFKPSSTR